MKRSAGAVLTVFIGVLASAACAHKPSERHVQVFGTDQGETRSVVDLGDDDDIAKNPETYVGRNVRVRGEVEKLVGDRGAVIDLDGLVGNDEILIFNNTGTTVPLKEGDKVEITGQVRGMVISNLEEELNTGLRDELYIEYRDTPVVVANTVRGYWPENRPTRPLQNVARDRGIESDESLTH